VTGPFLLLAALVIWAAAAALDIVLGAKRASARLVAYGAGVVGSALVTTAGVRAVLGATRVVDLGTTLGVGTTSIRLDPLAGLFLTLTGGLGVAISACVLSWARPAGRLGGRGTGAGYLLMLGAVSVVLVAGDAFTFLFAWEALTISFYVLVGIGRRDEDEARSAWATLGFGKAGGAALLFGFLLLAGQAHSNLFAAWSHLPGGSLHDIAFALLVVGFGAKVGIIPFQVWLPIGYPAAPGPIRAAMGGLAVNAGFYGLWRFLGVLGRPPVWLAVAVLIIGGVTALVGIVFATVQSGLRRVIAYSSVENAGIILVGYGVALAGAAARAPGVMAVGLLAASLQVLAHAVAKSSLFASSAFFESDLGTDRLEEIRGVGHRYRLSGTAFGIGSLTLAGLPPTIGFVSEWFLLEALMQEFRIHVLALRLGMALAGALVALTVGVALLCFIRLVGFVVLGPSTTPPTSTKATLDGGAAGRAGLVVMATSCLALAATAPWVVRFIAYGIGPVVPAHIVSGALRSPWVLQPVFANFSILSPSWLFVVMPVLLGAVAVSALALSRGKLLRIRRVPAWRSATAGAAGPDSYSPYGYANVLRHVLANVLGTRRTVVVSSAKSQSSPAHAHVEVQTTVVEPVEAYLYRPARVVWLRLATGAKRLQSGRLDAYVGYMLVALLVLLTLAVAVK
jgi:formate hydrogenlyase subunit 3/multisubunit Na+/H+ antiporter MnhD subunit